MDSSRLGRALTLEHGDPASAALPCCGKVWNLGSASVPVLLTVGLKEPISHEGLVPPSCEDFFGFIVTLFPQLHSVVRPR